MEQARPQFSPKRLGYIARFFAALAGVNAERLALCPIDDRHAVMRTGIAMLCSFAFSVIVLTGALSVAFGGYALPLALIAALMAGMIILIDHAIIQSHWFQSGLEDARVRGFDAGAPPPGRSQMLWMNGLRITLSLIVAFTMAGFVDLLIYNSDIQRQIAADHQAQNASVIARARAAADGEIAQAESELARLDGLLRDVRAQAIAADELANAGLSAKRRHTATRLEALQAELPDLESAARAARLDVIAEENGIRDSANHSGIAGRGTRYRAAEARALLAERRLGEIKREIAGLVEAARSGEPVASGALAAAKPELDAMAGERAAMLARRDSLRGGYDSRVATAIKADPDFVPIDDGLVRRLEAMLTLMEQPAVWIKVWGLKLVIMAIEMGGLATKILLVAPTLYALRTATEFETAAASTLAEASAGIGADHEHMTEAMAGLDALRERRDRDSRRHRTAAEARKWWEGELGQEFQRQGG
ncbi:MAG: DUF4407 domain-containing protein [Pseudomonadota bacterium]